MVETKSWEIPLQMEGWCRSGRQKVDNDIELVGWKDRMVGVLGKAVDTNVGDVDS